MPDLARSQYKIRYRCTITITLVAYTPAHTHTHIHTHTHSYTHTHTYTHTHSTTSADRALWLCRLESRRAQPCRPPYPQTVYLIPWKPCKILKRLSCDKNDDSDCNDNGDCGNIYGDCCDVDQGMHIWVFAFKYACLRVREVLTTKTLMSTHYTAWCKKGQSQISHGGSQDRTRDAAVTLRLARPNPTTSSFFTSFASIPFISLSPT